MIDFVILDRDGVINEDSPDYIKCPDEWHPVAGSLEAIARLTRSGIPVFVATNQAGVGRGKFDLETLQAIHAKLLASVEAAGGRILDIAFCPHHPAEGCRCRKPAPGLLLSLAETHGLALDRGCYVGDSVKDLDAASAAGCPGVLVLTGNGVATHQARPDYPRVYEDLAAFAEAACSGAFTGA